MNSTVNTMFFNITGPKVQRSSTTTEEKEQQTALPIQYVCITDGDFSKTDDKPRKSESEVASIVTEMLKRLDDANSQETGCNALSSLAYDYKSKTTISNEGGIEAIICAMNEHISHVGVQKEACTALQCLAHHHGQNIITIPSDGGIQAILHSMRNHSHHSGVQEEACKALYSLACNEVNKETISNEGGVDLIIENMKNHPIHAGVQRAACKALRNMAFNNDQIGKRISLGGGIEIIFATMEQNLERPDVQIEACKALYNLACNDETKIQISHEGGIPVLINTLKFFIENADVLQEACHTIYNLVSLEENKVKLLDMDGLSLILSIMKKHNGTVGVLKEVCKILRLLSRNDSAIKVKIARENSITQFFCYLMEHTDDIPFQKEACRILHHLTYHYVQNQICLGGHEHIPDIVDVMRLNRDHADVLEKACKVLNNLVVNDTKRGILMDQNRITIIIDSMNKHLQNEKFQTEATKLLKNLTSKSYRLEISREGGIEILTDSLIVHKSCAKIVTIIIRILQNYAVERRSRLLISDQKLNRAIISAMNENMSQTEILLEAYTVLYYMTLEYNNRLYITLCNGIKTLVEGMKTHQSEESIQEAACKVLRNLAVADFKIMLSESGIYKVSVDKRSIDASRMNMNSSVCLALSNLAKHAPRTKSIIRSENGIQAVLSAMTHHINHSGIQIEAFKALTNLATDSENRTIISDENGILAILGAMKNHWMDANLQKEACRALKGLIQYEEFEGDFKRTDGLQFVIQMMKAHTGNAGVQKEAWKVLRFLISNDCENKSIISHEGGFEAILSAAKENFRDNELQVEAEKTLDAVASGNSRRESSLRKSLIMMQMRKGFDSSLRDMGSIIEKSVK